MKKIQDGRQFQDGRRKTWIYKGELYVIILEHKLQYKCTKFCLDGCSGPKYYFQSGTLFDKIQNGRHSKMVASDHQIKPKLSHALFYLNYSQKNCKKWLFISYWDSFPYFDRFGARIYVIYA